ncbi:hypothetical protein RCL_jg14441.t1 [Rhizophagus clarus]|uniref:Uncharacterized protein n=1 Tax=Rhizophagus clarus TaxID=94130 RepID=A0A8H3LRJ6_9GLOM|nr:hypothetical protein RCL_jg14441.t1 [Rhizophagus clarus]
MIFKYKLLSEQLAVLKKTKRQYYKIYQDSCYRAYLRLYHNFRNALVDAILEFKHSTTPQQLISEFESLQLTRSLHMRETTFLDIIKECVPFILIEWLQSYLKDL